MSLVARMLGVSIGKKYIMGITGIALNLYIIAHLSGNFLLLSGAGEFNAYADFLHNIPGFLYIELGLALVFIVHSFLAVKLSIENKRARPQSYAVKKSAGVATPGGSTMKYTGPYILLFVIVHVANFRFRWFPSISEEASIYDVTYALFQEPAYVVFYVVSTLIVGLHVSHGFQSSFQSLGLNSSHYMPALRSISVVFGVAVGIGYAVLPIFMFLK